MSIVVMGIINLPIYYTHYECSKSFHILGKLQKEPSKLKIGKLSSECDRKEWEVKYRTLINNLIYKRKEEEKNIGFS